MRYKIALVGGDGVGPEAVSSAVAVLDAIGSKFGHQFKYKEVIAGGAAIDAFGEPLPRESIQACKDCEAVLLGAVGGVKWDGVPPDKRPERAILGLREELGLYVNLRPAKLYGALAGASPLREDIAGKGIDLVIVRELTGGIYFGERGRSESPSGVSAFDTERYSEEEVRRVGKKAFELAMGRSRRLVSVDKANVLESSRLWREVMHALSKQYPEVEYSDMYVDNMAMQLVRCPSQFDVVVTSNLFGDILSDEASVLTGSIGLLPSASFGAGRLGLYEPIHGSAPDIAGRGIANPVGAILSAAMLLRHSLLLSKEADCLEAAVFKALEDGARTEDISTSTQALSTGEMTEQIIKHV